MSLIVAALAEAGAARVVIVTNVMTNLTTAIAATLPRAAQGHLQLQPHLRLLILRQTQDPLPRTDEDGTKKATTKNDTVSAWL